ncbi:prolyl oligopeptidase family serine peptidase [Luteimonas fraxinea]|uniref:Prolyl oligopeptidase family serine peptidase n=1 Tax=Luteimonas fraxinea TaxID=2901869 RepID=A0ABS8UEJ7_9GAMM|nr:prolyl oligopeptidase family serine peptidase [Luteimonas fraxinea]MCD9097920.1 prolyl oligopeptidase family serine peptidase [Luteimonas fraxinea]UHH09345.1 prolyl oligopeptidase family serine peptidase [Luteimonas fraxinea]
MSNVSHSSARRRLLRGLALAGGAAVLSGCVSALPASGPAPGRFVRRELTSNGRRYAYQVFVPSAQLPRPLPAVLFLHGSGERGDDGEKQIHAGLGPYVRAHAADFPALVVFPQSPEGESWEGDTAMMALATLDAATAEFDGDRSRTSLTGMSRGGYGTWSLALREPTRFAALVPVCGGITPPGSRPDLEDLFVESTRAAGDPFAEAARRLRDIPVWIFHGALDDVVLPEQSRRMHVALRDVGADVRYTEFPDANHNSWDATYRTEALWPWLFAQKR